MPRRDRHAHAPTPGARSSPHAIAQACAASARAVFGAVVAALACALAAPPVAAQAPAPGSPVPVQPFVGQPGAPVLILDASATGRVPYDTALATLFIERDGAQAADPTREVSRLLGSVLDEARALKGVQARTGQYTTNPMFDRNGKITGYRVRAELQVESRDFNDFSEALGKLATRAPIASISYELSPAARAAEEERLLKVAADAFRKKAQAAAAAFGYPHYTLLEVQVGTAGLPGPRPVRAMAGVAAASAEMVPPPIAPETTTVTLTLSGRVRLDSKS